MCDSQNRERAMEFPPGVEFHEDIGLLIWRPQGLVDEAVVNQVISLLGHLEARAERHFNRFTDTRAAESIELNFKYVFHISLFRRFSYRGPPVKSAILVSSLTRAHYLKLHAILTQGSAINVRIFEDLKLAARWLAVEEDVLASPLHQDNR
jgi:hypothetical protein